MQDTPYDVTSPISDWKVKFNPRPAGGGGGGRVATPHYLGDQ